MFCRNESAIPPCHPPSPTPLRTAPSSPCSCAGVISLIVHTGSDEPLSIAAQWNRDVRSDAAAYSAAIDRWLDYFAQEGIEQIAFGCAVLRRRTPANGRPNWIRATRLPTRRLEPASAQLEVIFAAHDFIAGLADDSGLLPPWTRWWPREEIAEVLPDPWFDEVDTAAPNVPADYLSDTLEIARDWTSLRAGYLAFGDTYAEEWALAAALGWPARRLPGGHLLHLTDPAGVAGAIRELAGQDT